MANDTNPGTWTEISSTTDARSYSFFRMLDDHTAPTDCPLWAVTGKNVSVLDEADEDLGALVGDAVTFDFDTDTVRVYRAI